MRFICIATQEGVTYAFSSKPTSFGAGSEHYAIRVDISFAFSHAYGTLAASQRIVSKLGIVGADDTKMVNRESKFVII